MDDTRPFPIQGGETYRDADGEVIYPVRSTTQCTIPWWLAEEAYLSYTRHFGTQQSLERLAERGGFGRQELLGLLRGKKW